MVHKWYMVHDQMVNYIYFFSATLNLALRARGFRATSSSLASRPFSITSNGLRLLP